jgi:hypothetical membrane protein
MTRRIEIGLLVVAVVGLFAIGTPPDWIIGLIIGLTLFVIVCLYGLRLLFRIGAILAEALR